MPIVSVADEMVGGLVAVDLAQRVIDQTGRKPRVRFVSPETFALLRICGMDMGALEVTDEVFEIFFLTLTDSEFMDEVLSLVDSFYSARSHCPKLLTYLALTGTILGSQTKCTGNGGIDSAMNNPTNPNPLMSGF